MKATVLGASGFVGQALCTALHQVGADVDTPGRADLEALSAGADVDLGIVFYCIGMTGQFRRMPRETVHSQAGLLADILFRNRFDSFVYLSSTRVYGTQAQDDVMKEDRALPVLPSADTTYDLSKLLGEALCAAHSGRTISVRLSNIYGPGMSPETFLGSVLSALMRDGRVEIGEDPASSKDYLSVTQAAEALVQLALKAPAGCYNLAAGTAVTHQQIADHLRGIGYGVDFRPDGPLRCFPRISIDKMRAVYNFAPRTILEDLDELVASFQAAQLR